MRADDAMRAVAELAAARHGACARRLAATTGMTKAMIATRIARGDLCEPVPGVLFRPGAPVTFRARLSIAVQAGGGTVASHRAAAMLHGLEGFDVAPVEVSVRRGRYPTVDGVIVHRAKRLDPCDVTEVDGIAVTSVARTLCDLGAVVPQDAVERALDSALRRGVPEQGIREVHARVDRPGPSGTATLGRVLSDPRRSGILPDSWLERLIARSVAAPDLPVLELQHPVIDLSGRRIAVLDGCFVEWKIGIEGHSKAFHGTGRRVWTDLVRDNEVAALGYDLVYVTWDLAHRPDDVLDLVRRTHQARSTGS